MPIKDKSIYPPNWKEISRRIRFERAGGKCEWCGAENGAYEQRVTKEGLNKIVKIVLTVAHLDHDPTHNDDSNLVALCQACHLRYDVGQHVESRRKSKDKKSGQLSLF